MNRCVRRPLLLVAAALAVACGSSTNTTLTSPTGTRCQATASNSSPSFGAPGGTGTVTVSVARECSWSASTSSSWITFTSAREGQGDGTIAYRVAENGDPAARRGSIAVSDRQLDVSQEAAACRFQVSAADSQANAAGGQTTVEVRTHELCDWIASSDAAWITVSPTSGRGDGTVRVTIAPNGGAERSASVTVAGERIGVRQAPAAPPRTPAPSPAPPAPPPPPPTPEPTPPPPPPTPPPPTPPPPEPVPVRSIELRGKVESLSGTCPFIVVTVEKRTVYTTASTEFKRGPCKDVKKGKSVTVKGWEMSDTRIRADEIRLRDDDDDDDDDDDGA